MINKFTNVFMTILFSLYIFQLCPVNAGKYTDSLRQELNNIEDRLKQACPARKKISDETDEWRTEWRKQGCCGALCRVFSCEKSLSTLVNEGNRAEIDHMHICETCTQLSKLTDRQTQIYKELKAYAGESSSAVTGTPSMETRLLPF